MGGDAGAYGPRTTFVLARFTDKTGGNEATPGGATPLLTTPPERLHRNDRSRGGVCSDQRMQSRRGFGYIEMTDHVVEFVASAVAVTASTLGVSKRTQKQLPLPSILVKPICP